MRLGDKDSWRVGLGTEIRDVYNLGGVVLCGGLGTDIRDVIGGGGGGGQRPGSFGTDIGDVAC